MDLNFRIASSKLGWYFSVQKVLFLWVYFPEWWGGGGERLIIEKGLIQENIFAFKGHVRVFVWKACRALKILGAYASLNIGEKKHQKTMPSQTCSVAKLCKASILRRSYIWWNWKLRRIDNFLFWNMTKSHVNQPLTRLRNTQSLMRNKATECLDENQQWIHENIRKPTQFHSDCEWN